MKSKVFWSIWALVPVAVGAWHLGPGQCMMKRDRAGQCLRDAASAVASEDWAAAAAAYAAARDALPEGARAEALRLSIEEAKARIEAGEFVEGAQQLEQLIAEQEAAAQPDAAAVEEMRAKLGEVAYLTAWMMRIEGATADEWKPETEKARQQFRLLAETTEDAASAETYSRNLEAAIRLEQMDLSELLALPLPKKCCGNCKNLCDKKRKQRMSQCRNPGEKDAREEIKKDAADTAKKRGNGS